MARGPNPKPDDQRRRRNPPTIPTTALPAAGFTGPIPRAPKWIELAGAGRAWWRWAWRTPQAAAWGPGDLVVLARRASLEDDMHSLDVAADIDVPALLAMEESKRTRELDWLIRRLAALTGGRLSVAREARELDKVLGLTPKALADLRWVIVADEQAEPESTSGANIRRLRAVDTGAVAGA